MVGRLKNRQGQILILVFGVLVFLSILSASFLSRAIYGNNLARREKLRSEVTYLVEGGIEDALKKFARRIADFQISPTVLSNHVDTVYTLVPFADVMVSSDIIRIEGSERTAVEDGVTVYLLNYEITSTASHPSNTNIVVTLYQTFRRRRIPAFQHFVFYEDDLDLLPGPAMDVSGRMHSNHDIYIDANNTLNCDTFYLCSAGDIFNQRKDSPGTQMPGEVYVRVKGTTDYEAISNLDCDVSDWAALSQERWSGTVKSAVHGVTELTAPSVASTAPDGHYANNAGIKVENDTIFSGGTMLVEGVDIPPGAVTSNTDFRNRREDRYVKMTNIDLHKLAGYAEDDPPGSPSYPNHLPSNGLLYATRDDAAGDEQPGIRLLNGREIESSAGLSVVSNQPVYIQGDYNTGDKKPCAVISDALNILSNDWEDSKSEQSVWNRDAAQTRINSCFISGIVSTPDGGGNYSGGLENYPRFHEDWSGVALYLKGSFVSLWESQVATGEWHYGHPQYTAPRRYWDFDSDLLSESFFPPFTPWAVEIKRLAWWKS